jgi:DNA-binding NtrC family response regulator
MLADHFVRQSARQYAKSIEGITPDALAVLSEYAWPGNIRQLKNAIARSVILSRDTWLGVDDLPEKIAGEVAHQARPERICRMGSLPSDGVTLRDMEIDLIRRTLSHCDGNKSLAARRLGISRKALYEKIQRYALKR